MSTLPVRAEIADEPAEPTPTFWERPFVQNALPLITSFAVHAALVVGGVLTFQAVRAITQTVSAPPAVIPGTADIDPATPDLPQLGATGHDARALQNVLRDVPLSAAGLATAADLRLPASTAGGATGDDDPAIALGANAIFGKAGQGTGIGIGDRAGTAGGGGLAPFGPAPSLALGAPFVGCPGNARRVLYLCDSSGSMMVKLDVLREQLNKAIDGLRPIQAFDVLFFAQDSYRALDARLLAAVPENKRRAYDFLEKTTSGGTSDPIPGLRAAFAADPQLIYLLTDGDFPNNQAVVDEIRKLNAARQTKVKINTIAFMDRGEEYEKLLKQIADENDGLFRFVGETELGK